MTPIRVEVAMLPLKVDELAGVTALSNWLDAAECARAATFVSPVDSRLFVAAHALARMLLSELGGRGPLQWSLTTGRDGKPRVDEGAGGPVPVFSLSRTRSVSPGAVCGLVGVAAAVGEGCELGFDVEAHDPTLVAGDLAPVLTAREATRVRALPSGRQPAALARLWCLKEAVVKATGEGLRADLSRIGFDIDGRGVRLNEAMADQRGPWHIEHREDPDGSHAALAVRHPPATTVDVQWRRWSVATLAQQLHVQAQAMRPPAAGCHARS